jgi:hypothetical protein
MAAPSSAELQRAVGTRFDGPGRWRGGLEIELAALTHVGAGDMHRPSEI